MSTPREKVEAIALYLGAPWKFNRLGEPVDWRFEIIDGSGRGLFFRVDKDKFRISGLFPPHKTSIYYGAVPSIGVSITRPAKDIAADIKRRLIPDYLKTYKLAAEKHQNEQEEKRHLDLIACAFRKVTGGHISPSNTYSRTLYFEDGQAEIFRDDLVKLELRNLSIEQAIKILIGLNHRNG